MFRRAHDYDIHAGPLGGFNSRQRVFDNHASGRRQVQTLSREEKDVGKRLSSNLAAIGQDVDLGEQTGSFQHPSRITTGRADRNYQPALVKVVQEIGCAFRRREPHFRSNLPEQGVL